MTTMREARTQAASDPMSGIDLTRRTRDHDSFTVNTDPRHVYVDQPDALPYTDGNGDRRIYTRCTICRNVSDRLTS